MTDSLALRVLDALPQTQCRRCGYDDCKAYAEAVALGEAINRCPPGGAQGVAQLSRLTGRPLVALNPECGTESPRTVAWIVAEECLGCALCLKACPTDAIVGTKSRLHTIQETYCTGCELCLPVCPVDCIRLEPASGTRSGWDAWSAEHAATARARYALHSTRQSPPGRPTDWG